MPMSQYTHSLVRYLTLKKITYELVAHNSLGEQTYLSAILFKDDSGYVLVILPANCMLEVAKVSSALGRELKVLTAHKAAFADLYEPAFSVYCPFPELMKISAVIERTIDKYFSDKVFISYGQENKFIAISASDFQQLHKDTWQADLLADLAEQPNDITSARIQARIGETAELPIMPPIANQLLKMKASDNAQVIHLARLVEQDPSLCMQLINWACSPYYGYKGKITSINDAIINVLGFDLVINIALGLAISNKINIPLKGPLGLKAYWRQAVYTAALVEKIIYAMPAEFKAKRGMGYLCGLLYNFGQLLIGQLFPAQFNTLNELASANPGISILKIEQYLLQIDHQQVAQWLMQAWDMPAELQVVASNSANSDYTGEHAFYVDLIIVAKIVLSNYGIGAYNPQQLPANKLTALRLQESDFATIMGKFDAQTKDLDALVNLLHGN
jgi:HD-like signal output (HDOD) protein/prolyl-tRNA editing enzyme YbaK/EbsC (Cys-tRNA(Pro) deacylase)